MNAPDVMLLFGAARVAARRRGVDLDGKRTRFIVGRAAWEAFREASAREYAQRGKHGSAYSVRTAEAPPVWVRALGLPIELREDVAGDFVFLTDAELVIS